MVAHGANKPLPLTSSYRATKGYLWNKSKKIIIMLRTGQISLLRSLSQLWRASQSSEAAAAAQLSACSQLGSLRDTMQLVSCRWFSMSPAAAAASSSGREFITLNSLADNPGATHYVRTDTIVCCSGRVWYLRWLGALQCHTTPSGVSVWPCCAEKAARTRHRLWAGQDFWPWAQRPEGTHRCGLDFRLVSEANICLLAKLCCIWDSPAGFLLYLMTFSLPNTVLLLDQCSCCCPLCSLVCPLFG